MKNYIRVDGLYRNTNNWNKPEDEFNKFFRFIDNKGINNTSGFRPKSRSNSRSTDIVDCAFCVLVTNMGENEWPDSIDLESGLFTYYGDNRKPGTAINDTQVGGNRFLESIFNKLHMGLRKDVAPILCFETVKDSNKTYMRFLGLAAPGGQGLSATDDLVAIWKTNDGQRFQNYRAIFTILKVEKVSKDWLQDIVDGIVPAESEYAPYEWQYWVRTGIYKALESENESKPRSRDEQLPKTNAESNVIEYLMNNLSDREFEYASAELIKLIDPAFRDIYVTRATKDGGRDVLAKYYLGHDSHQIKLSACIEVKKWSLTNAIGVKPVMRLISRLKHGDVGVFITTSYFDTQVQRELIEDGHPVMLVSGGDIARILIKSDINQPKILAAWVDSIKTKANL